MIAAGDQVVVLGAGPIGLTAALAAADAGATVLVADRVSARLARARTLGAQAVVDTASQDLAAAVAEWTHGDGAAVVIEATGVPALIRSAFDLVAHSGAIVIVGISDAEVRLPVIEFTRKEISVFGSRNNAGIFADAVELVQRNAGLMAALITHRFALAEVAEAISFAQAHPDIAEKVIITMAGAA
jgi:L-gulonate 5-dehydrogenase